MGSKLIGVAQFFLDELSTGPETGESNANLIAARSRAVPKPNKQASVQFFESVRLQKVEGLHDNIGGQIRTVAAHPDASHPSTTYSFDTGNSVFYNDALLGRCSDASSGGQIHLRIWFSSVYIFRGNDGPKNMGSR